MPPKKRQNIGRHRQAGKRRKGGSNQKTTGSQEEGQEVTIEDIQQSIQDLLELMTDDRTLQIQIIEELLEKLRQPEDNAINKQTTIPSAVEGIVSNPEIVISMTPTPQVRFNLDAFKLASAAGVMYERKPGAARQAKHAFVKGFQAVYEKIATPEQKLLVIHSWLQKMWKDPPILEALGHIVIGTGGMDLVSNIRELWQLAASPESRRYSDAISFCRTLLVAMAPSVTEPSPKASRKVAELLGAKPGRAFYLDMKSAATIRRSIFTSHNRQDFVQRHKIRKLSRITADLMYRLEQWLLHECDLIVASPNAKGSVYVRDVETGEKVRKQKHYYLTSVRDIHNQLLATFPGAKNPDGKVMISDTMLRSLLPRNISRMTDSHKEMCGCEHCIISKQYLQAVSAWTTKYYALRNDLDINDEQMNAMHSFYFNDDQKATAKFEHPREVLSTMSCEAVNDGLFRMKCCLGRCRYYN
jgi:hypothetical protein